MPFPGTTTQGIAQQKKDAIDIFSFRLQIFGAAVIGLIQGPLIDDFLAKGDICAFNSKDEVCLFGTATGGISIALAIIFIVVDIMDIMGKYEEKKGSLMTFALDGVLAFCLIVLWLAFAIYSDEQWRSRPNISSDLKSALVDNSTFESALRSGDAVVVFAFLSFPLWVGVV